jgi:CelD/BcsL family acetyltransferase involved in cellulose biosynthesis
VTRTDTLHSARDLSDIGVEWNALARQRRTPFLTVEWLTAWLAAFGCKPLVLLLRDREGTLIGGATLERSRGEVRSASNVHTGDWDVVARDEAAQREVWRRIADLGAPHGRFAALLAAPATAGVAHEVLTAAGYGLAVDEDVCSPSLNLPPSYDELIAGTSRNLRQQVGRRRRALAGEGRLILRTTSGSERLDDDLEAFFRIEASGWKGRAGTAIRNEPRTLRLYRGFARAAAAAGSLRLRLLELDGQLLAGDLSCVFEGAEFLVKTGYDERYSRLSPGLVLRAEVLRAAIEEGLSRYEFMGGPDPYKLRWGAVLRPRLVLDAYRGPWRPVLWWRRSRPLLRTVRDLVRPVARAGQAADSS